jgi:hypothetical protein
LTPKTANKRRKLVRTTVAVEKSPFFSKTAEISGIENVYPRRERRLQGFLTQSFSDHFSGSEFFNSHNCFQ